MKTVDELMALADAYAAQWANGYDYPKTLRTNLLTALQEVVQPVTVQEAGQWAVDNSDAGQLLDIATHDPLKAPKMVWIPEPTAPKRFNDETLMQVAAVRPDLVPTMASLGV